MMPQSVHRAALAIALVASGCLSFTPDERSPPLPVGAAWLEADALFHQDARWLGADNAYSIPLGGDRALWLFGDSFIATSDAHTRREATMVSNTIALQQGLDPPNATMRFVWREPPVGVPRSDALPREAGLRPGAFVPDEGDVRHWPSHGARVGDALLLFWMRVLPAEGGLGFALDGARAILVDNPDDDPLAWRMRNASLPESDLVFGVMGVVVHEGHVLAYCTDEEHRAFLARWPVVRAAEGDLARPEWWSASGWSETEPATPVIVDGAPEGSVHYDATRQAWVSIQSTGFGATPLAVRTAPAPQGPWSAPLTFHVPEESGRDGVFVYAGKAHPELAGGGVAVTYATNSERGIFGLAEDDSLYWPRFVRLTWREG